MSVRPPASRRGEAGYSMVMLVGAIAIMLILMGAGVPTWTYIMKSDREEELIFRGKQIRDAIQRYQQKTGGAPISIEVLVKGKFLRKAYKDPMTEDGEWKLEHGVGGRATPGVPPPSGLPDPAPTPTPEPDRGRDRGRPGGGRIMGGLIGVSSRSREKSIRKVFDKDRYDQWRFIVGQRIKVGDTDIEFVLPGQQGQNPQGPNPNPTNPNPNPTQPTR